MPDVDDEPLDVSWARITGPQPETIDNHDFTGYIESTDLVIGSRSNPLVLIKRDGRLQFGPDYTPDGAAMEFWEAMGRMRLGAEDRILILQHMEGILVRLGQADMRAEGLRQQAAEATDPTRKRELDQLADLAINRMEMVAHEAIELGRGLVRRDAPTPPIPQDIPRSIQENEASQYRGAEILGDEA